MGQPGFWDDQERAAKTSAQHASAQRKLDSFRALTADADDLGELAELAEDDPEIAEVLDDQLASIEARLAAIEAQLGRQDPS